MEAVTELPCSAESAGLARRHVVDACVEWGLAGACDNAELLASELVSNAVRHARSSVRMRLSTTADGLLLEISDDSPRLPRRRETDLFDESGRGLWLVDALARRWGVEREMPGKRVWAEVAATG